MKQLWANAKKEPISTIIGLIILSLVTYKFSVEYLDDMITEGADWMPYVIGWGIGGVLIGSNIPNLLKSVTPGLKNNDLPQDRERP